MKFNVELISCLTYRDKDNDLSTRLGYRLIEKEYLQNSDKFKGYSEMSYFCKGDDLFKKLSPEMFGVQAILIANEEPSKSNPLRKVIKLNSIKVGNESIDLL